ncbi:MAG: hypothetical protein RLP44_29070 [Aggregatilineales bacterium]
MKQFVGQIGSIIVYGVVILLVATVLLLMLTIQPGESNTVIALRVIGALFLIWAINLMLSKRRQLGITTFMEYMAYAFAFDAQSLNRNCAGQLTGGQMLRLSSGVGMKTVIVTLLGVLFIAVGILHQPNADGLGGVFIALTGVSFIFYGGRKTMRYIRDLRGGLVSITGTLAVFTKREQGTYGRSTYRYVNRRYLKVMPLHGGEPVTFRIDQDTYSLVRQQPQSPTVTVYYLPRSNKLLSMEPAT